MSQGVLFFNHGTDDLERLDMSLKSLRQHWQGEVAIVDTKQAGNAVRKLAVNYGAEIVLSPTTPREPNARRCAWVSAWRNSPFVLTIQVKSGVIFPSSPQGWLNAISPYGSQPVWLMNTGGVTADMAEDFEPWRGMRVPFRSCWDRTIPVDDLIDQCLAEERPIVSSAIVGYRKMPKFLSLWERLTQAGRGLRDGKCGFLAKCDEVAIQLVAKMCGFEAF